MFHPPVGSPPPISTPIPLKYKRGAWISGTWQFDKVLEGWFGGERRGVRYQSFR